jgi:hypothetical protein
MSSKTIHNRFFLVLLSALLISCVATKNVQKEILVDERFIEITKPDSIQWEKAELFHIKGKLRLFLSDEGVSERASAEFRANGEQTLLKLRNSLGIEGMIILIDSDSVLEYNRIDKTAIKMERKMWQALSGVGNLPASLVQLLQPESFFDEPYKWYTSDRNFKVSSEFGTVRGFIPKNDSVISHIESSNSEFPFKSIEFKDYTPFQNRFIPKRITIFGKIEPRKISLQLADIRLDSDTTSIHYSLPKSITLQRYYD